jgi:hypothetical protein
LNKKFILFLHANAGFNRGASYAPNVSAQAQVPAADYANTDLIIDMIIDAKKSKVISPYLLDSGNLMKTFLKAEFNQGNDTGSGDQKKATFFDRTFDIDGFAAAGGAVANSTFLVTPYAAAFVNKNYYGSNVPVYDNDVKMWKYFINVPSFGVQIDVLHQRTCVNLKKDRFKHVWKYTLHHDFLTNPFGCADANGKRVSGILEYTKV